MNPGNAILIEKAANGYIVRDGYPDRCSVISSESMLVFNEMGFASAADASPTLLTFIERHFTKPKESP